MKTKTLAPLKVGQKVGIQNCSSLGTIAKRLGGNRYWVTLEAGGVFFTTIMNRNTFSL